MKTVKFEACIDQLCGFCPADLEGYHWEFKDGDRHYRYDITECYFNEDDDEFVKFTVLTNEPDALAIGVMDSFLWNIEEEAKKYF